MNPTLNGAGLECRRQKLFSPSEQQTGGREGDETDGLPQPSPKADGIEVQFDVTVPTIRDRVVQTAVKLVVEPIFEADFEPNTYGYRPRRSAADAIKAVHELLCQGYTDVVDADLSKYFDTIPHAELMQCVARRVVDRDILGLIKMWLKAPVEERDGNGTRRMSGGKASRCGTPQGGVVAPRTQKITSNSNGQLLAFVGGT